MFFAGALALMPDMNSDGASELIIVNALDWATHTKAARESDSSASSGSTSDDMAEPVVISTSGELAANFVRGLEPPQLRHNTLFTVLEMIGNCSLFSDAIASILAEAGFDVAGLHARLFSSHGPARECGVGAGRRHSL